LIGLLDKYAIKGDAVIILGIILAVIGYVTGVSILYSIGALLVLVGVVLWILGAVGRPNSMPPPLAACRGQGLRHASRPAKL
jgi:hypothetical protein